MVNKDRFALKCVAHYNGHSLKKNGNIDLSITCDYSELTNYIQLIQALNNDVVIVAKLPEEKPFKLGMFRIKSITVDGDGEGIIKFNSITDYVETDNVNKLIGSERFVAKFTSMIEVEEGGNEDEVQTEE